VKLAAYSGGLVFLAASLLAPPAGGETQTRPECSEIVTPEEIRNNDWISFHNGRVRGIDLAGGLLAVDLYGRHYGIYFNGSTQICHAGKPGTLRDLKVGDTVGGFTKIIKGRSVAVILGFGEIPYPAGIPVPGRAGWVQSPYAPSKPPIDVSHIPLGALVTCPYTGELFRNGAPPKN
jgi:hypothetical protein